MRKSIINWISSCVRYSRVLIHLLLSLSLSPFLSLFISLKTIHVFHYLKKNTKNNNKKSNCARKTCINSSHVKGIFMLFDSIFCYFFFLFSSLNCWVMTKKIICTKKKKSKESMQLIHYLKEKQLPAREMKISQFVCSNKKIFFLSKFVVWTKLKNWSQNLRRWWRIRFQKIPNSKSMFSFKYLTSIDEHCVFTDP